MNDRAPAEKLDRATAAAVASSKAPAIARAAAVLRLLGRSTTPQSLHSIARELGLVPSTCLYVLRALAAEEFVGFDPDTKRYTLQAGVLALARDWLRTDRFVDRARPLLESVTRRFEVTALGVQVSGLDHITVVAASRASSSVQVAVEVGSRFPALISATGRCIAAFAKDDPARLAIRFAALRWDAAPSFETWLEQVAETRRSGFAVDDGNYIGGVTVVAVPVLSVTDRMTHAIVALGLTGAVHRTGLADLQKDLLSASRHLSSTAATDI